MWAVESLLGSGAGPTTRRCVSLSKFLRALPTALCGFREMAHGPSTQTMFATIAASSCSTFRAYELGLDG